MVLPSVHTIINFPTKFFEMFTKKQSQHPQTVFQVFQVFRVFQVFHFAFGPQIRAVLIQIRTKTHKSIPSHLRHIMGAENTQKGNSPTCRRTRYYPASYRRSFIFGEADFLFSSISPKPPSHPSLTKSSTYYQNSRKRKEPCV